jgi:hypothetical protein
MLKKIRKNMKSTDGSILMMFWILFLFFLVVGVIVVDTGMVIAEKAKITTAADAAAIAGAYEFFEYSADADEKDIEEGVREKAEEIFYKNYGADASTQVEILIHPEEKEIMVNSVRRMDNFFARIFYIPYTDVKGQAYSRAKLEPVESYGEVIPFGLSYDTLIEREILDQHGNLRMDTFNEKVKWSLTAGNWGFLQPPNDQNVKDAIQNGMKITIGDLLDEVFEINSAPGNYSKDIEDHALNRDLIAPIVLFSDTPGKMTNLPVMGFMAIEITKVEETGANAKFHITIKRRIESGEIRTSSNIPDTGVYSVRLIR